MKRSLLLTISTIVLASISQAQISKGTVLLGGSVQASTNKSEAGTDESTNSGFQLSPSVGFAIRDNQVLGFSLTYGHSKNKGSLVTAESNAYGGSAYYRRYLTLGKGFYLFGQGDVGYSYSRMEQSGSAGYSNDNRVQSVYASFFPGITYTVSKRFHLEVGMNNMVSLGYNSSKVESVYPGGKNESKNNGLNFYTNANPQSNLSVGFRIVLGK